MFPDMLSTINTTHNAPDVKRSVRSRSLDVSERSTVDLSEGKCISLELIVTIEVNCRYNQNL